MSGAYDRQRCLEILHEYTGSESLLFPQASVAGWNILLRAGL